jgi:hypothetical protein
MFDFLTSCTLLTRDNNITTSVNIIPNHQLMSQLVYGLDTYDHAMYVHFHRPLNVKLSTCLQLILTMNPINTISCVC